MSDKQPKSISELRNPHWIDELRPGVVGRGFIEKQLRHTLMFVERPVNRLLVTFDNLSNVGDTSIAREPWAFKFARDINVSHLGIMANVGDWYRDPDLIDRMQTLVDDGFFDGYDRVIFAGVSMGGFAAITFGSLVKSAHVVAINPQSTLDTNLVPWETRYSKGRRQDWTLPRSDAASDTSDLERLNIFYDPYHELDSKHVARFSGDNIRVFNCRYSNHKTAVFLRKIDALKPIMKHAVFDELTKTEFYNLYRERQKLPWFRGALASYYSELGRFEMAERVSSAFMQRKRKLNSRTETEDEKAPLPDVEDPKITAAHYHQNDKRLIVTTMKNEGPFMLEWIAYHRSIGFTDFLIYTNDCNDGTDAIAKRLEQLGVAQHVDNVFKKGASPQRVALRRALAQPVYQESDWALCADCDEFLNIRVGQGHLDDLFKAVGDSDAISLCWKIFGCGGQVEYKDKFVTEQFTWAAEEAFRAKYKALGLKTLFRPSEAIFKIGVHRPKFHEQPDSFLWKDAGGQIMPKQYFAAGWSAHKAFSHTYARLHHYAVRSTESFLVKRDRGRTNHIDRDQGLAYWADLNLNMAEDTSLLKRLQPAKDEFEKLLADPVLAELHEDACKWHRSKIDTLKADAAWRQFHDMLSTVNRLGEQPVDREALLQEETQNE
ncbi:Glycosyl transferase family 2 [Shimia gijangensis]|uniref:Glycosyl transferase family 2 n=1 Tax=Shimia gijangensis TaxID=1470563 RepID=A0A1M6CDU0_9RHOB|nr:glycosyltransferase family 2 protein [Shimia gijangensis]SHI59179.1 Glycosyl transferase family 2 [Shimia gijangensis]